MAGRGVQPGPGQAEVRCGRQLRVPQSRAAGMEARVRENGPKSCWRWTTRAGAVGAAIEVVAAWFLLAVAVGAIWTFVGVMSSPRVVEAMSAAPGGER